MHCLAQNYIDSGKLIHPAALCLEAEALGLFPCFSLSGAPKELRAMVQINKSLLPLNSLFLHASAVHLPAGGLLFTGHSTSGKSTIGRLMSAQFPVIADDVVMVRRDPDGKYRISDGKPVLTENFALGKSTLSKGFQEYELMGVTRLFKAGTHRLERISALQLCRYLADALFEVDFQRKIESIKTRQTLFVLAAQLAREIPGWHLWFSLETRPEDLLLLLQTEKTTRVE